MAIFRKKQKKEEEPVTSSVQDVSNNKGNIDIQVVEPEPENKKGVKDMPPPPPPENQDLSPMAEFTVTITAEKILRRIHKLQESKDLQLYMKVMEGQEEYNELQELMEALPDEYKG